MNYRNIAFVMPYHPAEIIGGAELQAWLYSKELAASGYNVYYLCQSTAGKKGKCEIIEGVNVVWLGYHRYFDLLGVKETLRALDKISPDIIIQRMSNSLSGFLSNYASKKGKKYIWICTDNETPKKLGLVKKYIGKTKSSINPYYWLKWILFFIQALLSDISKNYGIKKCSIAFTQNDFQSGQIEINFSRESKRIYSGHPLPDIAISAEERFKNKIIIWSGNLGKHKRPELFVDIARHFSGKSDYKFIMIGDKSDMKDTPEYFINAPDNFTWTGKLNYEENTKMFDKATLLINTSVFEGFSNTFIQAWLRGIPVLTYGIDPDNIIAGNNLGFVLNSTDDVCNKIDDINSYESYQKLSANISEFARVKYFIGNVVKIFMKDIYEN